MRLRKILEHTTKPGGEGLDLERAKKTLKKINEFDIGHGEAALKMLGEASAVEALNGLRKHADETVARMAPKAAPSTALPADATAPAVLEQELHPRLVHALLEGGHPPLPLADAGQQLRSHLSHHRWHIYCARHERRRLR